MSRPRTVKRYEIDSVTGCWNWLLSTSPDGYGKEWSTAHRQMRTAHINSYEKHRGKVPEGYELDHKCRNRRCINPDHLEPVTDAVNTWRGDVCKLTSEQVAEIKSLLALNKFTRRQIGEKFGVKKSTIQKIASGKNWVAVA